MNWFKSFFNKKEIIYYKTNEYKFEFKLGSIISYSKEEIFMEPIFDKRFPLIKYEY